MLKSDIDIEWLFKHVRTRCYISLKINSKKKIDIDIQKLGLKEICFFFENSLYIRVHSSFKE